MLDHVLFRSGALLLIFLGSGAKGQTNVGLKPPKPDLHVDLAITEASFEDAVTALATKFGVRAIADNKPPAVRVAIDAHGSLREVLDTISRSFSYSWSTTAADVVLFRRVYPGQTDCPQAVLPELQQAAKDLLTCIPPASPDPNHRVWGSILIALYDALDASQRQALEGGQEIANASLSPFQRSLLERAVFTRAFGRPRSAAETFKLLVDGMALSAIVVLMQTAPGTDQPLPDKPRIMAHVVEQKGATVRTFIGTIERGGKR